MLLAGSAMAAEPGLALVVGNSAYQSLAPLPECQASASVVSAALRRAGWRVTEVRDPSNGQMGAAIGSFADRLAQTPEAAALVYACGYGAGFERRLFLLPASARIGRETDILTEGVVAPALTGAVARADPKAGLVVLDLVAAPGSPAPGIDAAALRTQARTTGVFAALAASSGANVPTQAAAALAATLDAPALEVGSVIDALGRTLEGAPNVTVLASKPLEPAWLREAPPPNPPPEPPAPAPPPPPVIATQDPPSVAAFGELDRRRVQLALQRLGYYAGRVDGVFGAESLAAIRRYQHELGGAMTGRLTDDQAARLLAPP